METLCKTFSSLYLHLMGHFERVTEKKHKEDNSHIVRLHTMGWSYVSALKFAAVFKIQKAITRQRAKSCLK